MPGTWGKPDPSQCSCWRRDPWCLGQMHDVEGALATAPHAVQTLGISPDFPGDNCLHQEAKNNNNPESSGMYWQFQKRSRKTGLVLAALIFLRFYGLLGWVHLGMVPRCWTTNSGHGADAVQQHPQKAVDGAFGSPGVKWVVEDRHICPRLQIVATTNNFWRRPELCSLSRYKGHALVTRTHSLRETAVLQPLVQSLEEVCRLRWTSCKQRRYAGAPAKGCVRGAPMLGRGQVVQWDGAVWGVRAEGWGCFHGASAQGSIRMDVHCGRTPPPWTPPPPPTKVTIVRKNKLYNRVNLIGISLVHTLLGPRPPPPIPTLPCLFPKQLFSNDCATVE